MDARHRKTAIVTEQSDRSCGSDGTGATVANGVAPITAMLAQPVTKYLCLVSYVSATALPVLADS